MLDQHQQTTELSKEFFSLEKAYNQVDKLITDVDGVLTDGTFLYSEQGKVYKKFGPHDSDGVKLLRSMNISVQAITADKRGFDITKSRLNDMNIELTFVSEQDRLNWLRENCGLEKTAFVGDGLYDAPAMRHCAVSFAPLNAVAFAKQNATKILEVCGGNGALLEVALEILSLRDPKAYYELQGGFMGGHSNQ
jgi:YrbI family 3-deoxy-D-manno-octulosonate 8-phosphate phosphatase